MTTDQKDAVAQVPVTQEVVPSRGDLPSGIAIVAGWAVALTVFAQTEAGQHIAAVRSAVGPHVPNLLNTVQQLLTR